MFQRWSSLRRNLISLANSLSFNSSVRGLVETLNRTIAIREKTDFKVNSHPSGFARALGHRRLTMAEAYLKLVTSQGLEHYQERLDALAVLIHMAWHAKTLSLPLNTARVQIGLMKDCVQSHGDVRRQLELMSDFERASYGQENRIRALLGRLSLMDVPDDGRPLNAMNLGWDDHVHDSLSEGRKTPSQLMVDAFIKGISRLVVVYRDLADPRVYQEILGAGRILGIDVQVGIELSVGTHNQRIHGMYIPPQDGTPASIHRFLAEAGGCSGMLTEGLEANAEARKKLVLALLEQFNQTRLPELNGRFRNQPFLHLAPISWEDLLGQVHGPHFSRLQLEQVIADKLRPVFHRRVLYLRNQFEHAQHRQAFDEVSSWEVDTRRQEYLQARREYESCRADVVGGLFLHEEALADYDSAFTDMGAFKDLVHGCGGRMVLIHPLSLGAGRAVQALIDHHGVITDVETFNMWDSLRRDPSDVLRLNRLVQLLNTGAGSEVAALLADWGLAGHDSSALEAACQWYHQHPLTPRCGTDYVGLTSKIPGIGFVAADRLSPQSRKAFDRHGHAGLPLPVGELLLGKEDGAGGAAGRRVVALTAPREPSANLVGDEELQHFPGWRSFWQYLNPNLKGLIKILIGFLPAYFMVGPWYAMLWLGITGFRTTVADLISTNGLDLRHWKSDNVDKENVTNAMFWTGFSVPILSTAKAGFDAGWGALGWETGTFLFTMAKFWVIALANGLYITTHNRLRGFPKGVIRANFFRTVLSWPLATLASYGLDPLAVPAIVQAKVWSDVVAGIIEGTGKFAARLKLRERDFVELCDQIVKADRATALVAATDVLYVWARRDRGRTALGNLMRGSIPGSQAFHLMVPHDRETVRKAHDRLTEIFSAEGSMESLTGMILQNYSGREAVQLCQFVADNHQPFLRWLRQTKPR